MAGEDLFAGTAWYYARYRPGYPPEMIDWLVEQMALDGTGRLLDLGCGTGQLILPLAPHVTAAIGMDPDIDMLAEAAAAAMRMGIENVEWVAGRSDDLTAMAERLAPLRLVVMGRSFHWMDGDQTLRDLDALVEPGGAVLLTGDGCGIWSGDLDWQVAVRETIRDWLGAERRAGKGTYQIEHDPWEVMLARSPFASFDERHFPVRHEWTIETIVGFLSSTSFASPHLLGDRRAPFEVDLRRRLLALDPSGMFAEDVVVDAFLAHRHGELRHR